MPPIDLSPDELNIVIDYARRKYRAERWPMSPELRPIREVLAKLEPRPEPAPEPRRSPATSAKLPPRRGLYGRKLWPGASKGAEPAA